MEAEQVQKILEEACAPHDIMVSDVEKHTHPMECFSCRFERDGKEKVCTFLENCVTSPEAIAKTVEHFNVGLKG